VLERGSDMVLATHFTPLGGRLGLVAQTVETVRFTRPERVDFRLVRGPVPHVVEAFVLTEQAGGDSMQLAYHGEIGADLWQAGQRWCELVARRWEQTVAASLAAVKAEAERRAASLGRPRSSPRPTAPIHRSIARYRGWPGPRGRPADTLGRHPCCRLSPAADHSLPWCEKPSLDSRRSTDRIGVHTVAMRDGD
jgi:hypothetical protein